MILINLWTPLATSTELKDGLQTSESGLQRGISCRLYILGILHMFPKGLAVKVEFATVDEGSAKSWTLCLMPGDPDVITISCRA